MHPSKKYELYILNLLNYLKSFSHLFILFQILKSDCGYPGSLFPFDLYR